MFPNNDKLFVGSILIFRNFRAKFVRTIPRVVFVFEKHFLTLPCLPVWAAETPVGNMRLKLALTKAKQNNVPKDNIQRAIAKGVGAASGAGFDEITYEGYGPGGAAVIVECNTDNRNRAAADVRHAFTHHGGSIGTPGCVAWMFKKKGMIVVNKEAADEDTIMMIALDAGAEDVSTDGDSFEITTAPEDFLTVSDALEKEGIAVEASEVTMVPDNTVSLEGDAADVMNKLTGELEELDDVQDVYTNAELPEDME